jgi:hypothetical protein
MAEITLAHPRKGRSTFWGTFWSSMSFGLHIFVIFSLVYFTPLREWFFARPDPQDALRSLDGARVGQMADVVVQLNTRRMREKIGEQKELLAKLEDIRKRRYERYVNEIKTAARGRDAPAIEPLESLGVTGPDPNVPLHDKNIMALYEVAKLVEQTTYGTYRQWRAIELARIQHLALGEASEATKVVVPQHPALRKEMFEQVITSAVDGKLEALKNEIARALMEVESMISAGQRMLDVAEEVIGDDVGATIGYDTGGSGPTGGGGEGEGKGRKAIFMGYSPPTPDAYYHTWGVGVGPVVHKNEIYPHSQGALMGQRRPVGARKLMADGVQADWLYMDTWYVIGPFPNPNRENLDKKFPPESAVDLDGVYIGARGKRVRWLFRQSATVCIFPHEPDNYMIWYAYSEVYSEKEQDRWCIFGSDDFGKCWVNDELVFTSGKTPHPWIPDRGYAQVHFKRGYNKVLFKLENAWGNTGFSMCIFLGENL